MTILDRTLAASAAVVNTISSIMMLYAGASYTAGIELFAPMVSVSLYEAPSRIL
jgi:hypothetical protein